MRLLIIFSSSLFFTACFFQSEKQIDKVYYASAENQICLPHDWAGQYSSFTVSRISESEAPKEVVHFWSQGGTFLIEGGACINLWDGPINSQSIMKRSKLMSGNYIVNVRVGERGRSALLAIDSE